MKRSMKKYFLPGTIIITAILLLVFISHGRNNTAQAYDAVIYKSPTCGCCVKYASYLTDKGYKVKIVKTNNMDAIKRKYNIPEDMESCHTMVTGDKVIEGHIPLEVVEQALADDSITGIALPDMPAGSPGMPGTKQGPFTIFSLEDSNPVYINY